MLLCIEIHAQQIYYIDMTKRLTIWVAIVALLLLIPLALTIRDGNVEGVGWNWSPFDFLFMGVLLFGAGVIFELITRKFTDTRRKIIVGLIILAGVLLVWVEGAVGIIGNN